MSPNYFKWVVFLFIFHFKYFSLVFNAPLTVKTGTYNC